MKIYVASSWKNIFYDTTCAFLKEFDHTILDWRRDDDFSWRQVTDNPVNKWTSEFYRDHVLNTPRAVEGFFNNTSKIDEADMCVLLLPCGRSSHLEAGVFVGSGKPLIIYIPVWEGPDLMYKWARKICFNLTELASAVQSL
jgi:hypothetical protein